MLDLINGNIQIYRDLLSFLVKHKKMSRSEFNEIALKFGVKLTDVNDGERLILDYKSLTDKFLSRKKRVDKRS